MTICVDFRGIEIHVVGEYIPMEHEVRYHSDMSGTPASPEGFEIKEIYIENTEVSAMLEEHMEEIEKIVLETLNIE